jgi:hypothetical protein
MLFNTNLATTLQKANAMRNNWSGHAGAISHKQAEHIHAELMDLVQTTRNIFGITWLSYELIQAGEGRYQGGLHKYKVRRMVGTRSTPFESVDRECTEPFEDGFLYLFDPGSDRGLKLLPLVKIMPSPRTATPACYFYNRKEKHQYRYLSYHFEEDSELIDDFADVAEMLKRLGLS